MLSPKEGHAALTFKHLLNFTPSGVLLPWASLNPTRGSTSCHKVASALTTRVHMQYGTSLTLDEIIDVLLYARFLYPKDPCRR
jgi:hypothetical protein